MAYTPGLAEIRLLLAAYRWHGEVVGSILNLPAYPNPIRGERYFVTSTNQFVECRYDRRWAGGYYTTPTVGSVYADRSDGTSYILSGTGWQPYKEFLEALGLELGAGGGASITAVADLVAARAVASAGFVGGEALITLATTTAAGTVIPVFYVYDATLNSGAFGAQTSGEPAIIVPTDKWTTTKIGAWINQHFVADTEPLIMKLRELRFGATDQVILEYFDLGGGVNSVTLDLTGAGIDALFVQGGLVFGSLPGPILRGGTLGMTEGVTMSIGPAAGFGTPGHEYLYGFYTSIQGTAEPMVAGATAYGYYLDVGDNAADTGGEYVGFAAVLNPQAGLATATAFRVTGLWDVALDAGKAPVRLTPPANAVVDLVAVDQGANGELQATTNSGAVRLTDAGLPISHMDRHFMIAGQENVANVDGVVVIGQIAFNGMRVKTVQNITMKYVVIAAVSAAVTGTVQLYNVTDAEVVSTVTVNTSSPTKYENTLTLGAAAGNIKLADKVYEVRTSVTGSTTADIVFVGQAYFRLEV